jgi:hypothetical protein
MSTPPTPSTTHGPEAPSPEVLDRLDAEGRAEDRGFGTAILLGSAVGIALLCVLCFVAIAVVVGDDVPVWANVGISLWVGVWAGLFLGGTVAVGRWSQRRSGH